jgi:hypothetical protein
LLSHRLGFAIAVAALGAGCFTEPVNMSPSVRLHQDPPAPVFRGTPITYSATASDPDGDSYHLEWTQTDGNCPDDFDLPSSWPTDKWRTDPNIQVTPQDTAPFCVWVKAVDRYGAAAVDASTTNPQDNAPVAMLVLTSPDNAPSFPARTHFVLSAQGSSDVDVGDTLSFTWTLKSSPSPTAMLIPCGGAPPGAIQCLDADAAGDYEVEVTVADDATPSQMSSVEKTLRVLPGMLPVGAIDLIQPAGAGPYPLGNPMRVSAAHATGLDAMSTRKWTLDAPKGSLLTEMGSCDGDATDETRCFVPDVPGDYHVTLVVHNDTGDSAPVVVSYSVAPDQPPCLARTTPDFTVPVTTMTTFNVDEIDDDRDPFPGAQDMNWLVSVNGGDFVLMQKDFPSFPLGSGFSFADVVRVRLEIRDRDTERSAKEFLACDKDVCSAPSLIHPDACIQRVTWTVHILP